MSVKKTKVGYKIRFQIDSVRISKTYKSKNKLDAERYEAKLKNELLKRLKFGEKPRKTWIDAVVRWLNESADKRSLSHDKDKLRWLDPYFSKLYLDEITRDLVDEVMEIKRKENVKPATINNYLALIRSILRKAEREWEWIERAPTLKRMVLNNQRIRWVTPEEAQRLIDELPYHLKESVIFALYTGLRKSNIAGLMWEWLDLEKRRAYIPVGDSKNKTILTILLNDIAYETIMRQKGIHPVYVFTFEKKPVKHLNTAAFRKALLRADIKDFHFHDLRHTWASWHVQAGTSIYELMNLGGWKTLTMPMRYAHLSTSVLDKASKNIMSGLKVVNNEISQGLKDEVSN